MCSKCQYELFGNLNHHSLLKGSETLQYILQYHTNLNVICIFKSDLPEEVDGSHILII